MTRKKSESLTPLELEIMNVLWDVGSANVQTVQRRLARDPAYTTVQTIIGRLEQKGAVRRTRKIGNAFMFEPAITRKSAYRRVVDEMLALFGGEAQPVVAHLLEAGKLTLEDLHAIEKHERARQGARK